jgi:hypothetical protein
MVVNCGRWSQSAGVASCVAGLTVTLVTPGVVETRVDQGIGWDEVSEERLGREEGPETRMTMGVLVKKAGSNQ